MAANADASGDDVAVSDHFRLSGDGPVDADLPPGVYRVVGTPEDSVTVLRVVDADGRRVHTGQIHRVPRTDLDRFEPATNPDENRSLAAAVAGQLDGLAWQGRLIGRAVAARPIPGAIALALVAAGLFGDPYLPIPELFDVLLFLAGVGLLVSLTRTTTRR
ncbi:hypothetical protein SAMN05216559_0107 [Halomicrobium zhouii]|uniref:Uncharacterized protein n=1 Tax=Halomicrobium zhouii TaxID=767519 RepID=A0A1I6K2U7_9EURY|nr:hypothetical protein [Halomicrobium zhouii]SFR85562.1 hypothetical protein SAMN05216559_0107 [Halomicrobium zhouii]